MYVYVTGPWKSGDQGQNISTALLMSHVLMDRGYTPFVPHLYTIWNSVRSRSEQEWLDQRRRWMWKCDVVFRLPGQDRDADADEALALSAGKRVFYVLDDLPAPGETGGGVDCNDNR